MVYYIKCQYLAMYHEEMSEGNTPSPLAAQVWLRLRLAKRSKRSDRTHFCYLSLSSG